MIKPHQFDEHKIPQHMRQSLQRWITEGYEPGNFMQAVLQNRLDLAVLRADDLNISMLKNYVQFLQMEAPEDCYGSPDKYNSWKNKHEERRAER